MPTRSQAALTAFQATRSLKAAALSFVFPSSMSWTGSSRSFLSIAPRSHSYRNLDPLDNSAVMNCLAWIFRNFGQGVMRAVREARDGQLKAVNVPGLLELVYNPNKFHAAFSFWAGTLISYHVDGNAYWIKVRNARGFGLPTELWYEPHWSMCPHYPEDGSVFIDYYERRVNGQTQKIPVENVIHFRNGLNPANTRYGLAPLKVAMLEVFTDQEAAMYTASLLRNMAIPGVVVNPTTPIGITAEKAAQIKETWQRKFGGDNRGEPLILDFEAAVTTIGFSPSDMNFTEIRRIGEERISGCFGLPAIVAGLGAGLEASTYNNLKELKKSAFEDCLQPTWDYFAEEITRQLLPDFTNDASVMADFDTSRIAALKEDEDKRNQRITERVKSGIITVGQAQTDLGYVADPDANYYLIPNNVRPTTAQVAMARAKEAIEDPKPQVTSDSSNPVDSGKGLKLLPAFSNKAVIWDGMMLRREPSELEKSISIKSIDDAMRQGSANLETQLLALRRKFIDEAIEELDDLDEAEYHMLTVEPTDSDRSVLYGILAFLFLRGAKLIVQELNNQGAAITEAERATQDQSRLSTLASVIASKVANDVQSRVIASAQSAALLSQPVADRVRSDMDKGSTGYVTRAANEGANTALAAGRKAEIEARDDEINLLVYSAVLDANTCEPCGAVDGVTGQADEIPPVPNPDCPGGAQCRCIWIPVRQA